jgi:hypothetical protein
MPGRAALTTRQRKSILNNAGIKASELKNSLVGRAEVRT